MAATLAQHIAARNDQDLYDRFVAQAEINGVANAALWAQENRGALVAASLDSGGDTVASVYAYALSQYGGRPGENPTYVTDAQISTAVAAVQAAPPA